jgi:hypothetical protein
MKPLDGFLFTKTETTYAKNFQQRLGTAAVGNP